MVAIRIIPCKAHDLINSMIFKAAHASRPEVGSERPTGHHHVITCHWCPCHGPRPFLSLSPSRKMMEGLVMPQATMDRRRFSPPERPYEAHPKVT
jgi:hypothetical protein